MSLWICIWVLLPISFPHFLLSFAAAAVVLGIVWLQCLDPFRAMGTECDMLPDMRDFCS